MNKFIRAWVLALSFIALPLTLSVSAQTGTDRGGTGNTTPAQTTRDDRDTDWGWIGLLGLAGLAGLLRRREDPVRSRANEPMTSR
jgi:MYXO-CTERM domain-containing protein